VLTDECDPDCLQPINVEEILSIAKACEPNLITLFKDLIARS
jgi:purine-nucleoside phosphorylase